MRNTNVRRRSIRGKQTRKRNTRNKHKRKRHTNHGGHPVKLKNENINAWKRLPTCTGIDCAFNVFTFLYGEDPKFLKEARDRFKNPNKQTGVLIKEQIEYLDRKFPKDKPHKLVKIMDLQKYSETNGTLLVRTQYILTELLDKDEALPLIFTGYPMGHIGVLARDLNNKIYYFDPQSQILLKGFQQIGEYMIIRNSYSGSVIVPQNRTLNDYVGEINKYPVVKSVPKFKEDEYREGFKVVDPNVVYIPPPPEPKYGAPGAPGNILLPKALTPERQHLKDHTFSENSWVPISKYDRLSVIHNCKVEDKWEDWNNYCPEEGGLHGQHNIGCIFNVLGFLNVISIPEARREVEDVNVGSGIGTPFNLVINWFNSAKQQRSMKYLYQEFQIHLDTTTQDFYKKTLKQFFDNVNEKMPINSCTLVQLVRPSPQAGHYVILSKTKDNKLITIDPQLSKKSEYKGSVDKFWKLYWDQSFYRISVIIALDIKGNSKSRNTRKRERKTLSIRKTQPRKQRRTLKIKPRKPMTMFDMFDIPEDDDDI